MLHNEIVSRAYVEVDKINDVAFLVDHMILLSALQSGQRQPNILMATPATLTSAIDLLVWSGAE